MLEILKIYDSKNKNINDIAEKMYQDLLARSESYFKNTFIIAASYLDQRYKKFLFIKDQNERDLFIYKAITFIKNTCLSKFKETPIEIEINNNSKRIRTESLKSYSNNFNLLCEELEIESNNDNESDIMIEIQNEIKLYFNSKIKVEEHTNPLDYFLEKQYALPYLTHIAKLVYSATASSVPSESLFSHTKDVITDRRNRLRPDLVEELMIISENSKFSF